MRHIFNSRYTIFILLLGLVCFGLINSYSWEVNDGETLKIISSDGNGYYMYLPNVFIHHNLSKQKIDKRHIIPYNKRAVNKYFVGASLTMSPFFGLGWIWAKCTDQPTDGYSQPFQKSISLAGLFYLLLGVGFSLALLRLYNLKEWAIIVGVLCIVFGTNLLVYAVVSPSMSHVYSFAFIAGFLYFAKRFFLQNKPNLLYLAILFLGVITLIRPLNIIIIFAIPFLAGSWYVFLTSIKSTLKLKPILFSILIFSGILFLQFLAYFLQTGEPILWSYRNEGFYFGNPAILKVLFSFRKGWFIYTPIAFLVLSGSIFLVRKNKFAYGSILFFFILLIYLISSWWNWYYGSSFSQRPFIEFYPLLILLLGLEIDSLKSNWIPVLHLIFIPLISLNLIQSYQYQVGIISSWQMNFEKYKYTFLKTSDEYIDRLGGYADIKPYQAELIPVLVFTEDFETENDNTTRYANFNGNAVSNYSSVKFNTKIEARGTPELVNSRGIFAKISLERLDLNPNASKNALVVIDMSVPEYGSYYYQAFKLNEIPDKPTNKWEEYTYTVDMPPMKSQYDKIAIYVWNYEFGDFYIDNLVVELNSVK